MTPPDLLPVFNAQPGATLLLSPEWVIVGASDDYLAATLTERATIVGQYIFDAFPDNPQTPEANAVANVRASLTQAMATRQPHDMAPQHYDVPDPSHPGRFVERHWKPRHTPVLDAAGQVQFIIQSVQDITLSIQAARQLRDSQAAEQQARAEAEQQRQRFHAVLMQLPAYVAVYHGPEHVYQFVNPPYQSMFPHRSFAGRPFREGIPEAQALGVVALFDRVYQTGEPYHVREMEGWFDFRGTGEPEQVFLDLYLHPLRDAQGRIDGILDYSYNVTEQVLTRREVERLNQELEARVFERTQALRHAQAEAVAATQRLLRITESLPSTSFTVDVTGQVRYISPQWYAYTGMAPGTDINEVWPTLIHPDDLPAIAGEFGAALAEGRPWRYEFRLRGAAGQYRWFASQGVPEPLEEAEEAGRPRQWFGANLDIDELKKIQQQLEEKDELLTSILSSIPASVATFEGEDLRLGFFNEAYQHLAQGRAVLGLLADEIFPETEEQGFLASMRRMLRTGEPYQGQEVPAYARDPHTGQQQDLYLDLAYLPLRHGQHPPHAVLGFIVDVTDRVLARRQAEALQAELLAAAQRQVRERAAFYEIFEHTTALIVLLRGPEHHIDYYNAAYQQFFSGRALVGRPFADMAPEAEGQGFVVLLDRVYETGETYFGVEMPFVTEPTGDAPAGTRYFNFTFQRFAENGQPAGISTFAYDVTEQVHARRQREAQQVQLHNLFMQAPIPVVIFDGPALTYQLVNPAYQHVFPGRQLLGFPLLEALPELAGTPLLAHLDHVYETGETYLAQELPMQFARHRGGPLEERYFTFTYQARRNEHGAVDGALLFGHEVTDQVRARRQVADANEQLTAANRQLTRTNVDLDNFIYTASHDLKAPITNIEGLLDTLRHELPEQPPTGEVAYILDLMQGAVERFQRTIEQLTDVSKLQKEHDPPTAQVALAPVLDDVRQDLAPLLRQTGGQLRLDVATSPPLRFAEKNLRSVLYNLLSNAFKYRHPDRVPDVHVRCRPEAGFTVLEVQDNGLGLDLAHETQLFAMFQRLHSHVEGSGLGLYMVKRMVENAGGHITVQSQVGEGTTFAVYFPH